MASRAKVLQGTTVVLSGLIPLNADFMRYLNNIPTTQFTHNIYLKAVMSKYESKRNLPFYRSEIALQALSFGADVQTK
jgi:hypothetical protein